MDLRGLKVRRKWWIAAILCLGSWPLICHGGIEVEVNGVDEAARANVLVFLSLQRYRESNDLPEDTVRRLNERVEREVRQALRPFGYYFPKVQSELKQEKEKNNWRVQITIEPGQPTVLSKLSVIISGPGENDPALRSVVTTSSLKENQRLIHGEYDKLKGDLQRLAVSSGYLEASFAHSELRVDLERFSAEAHIELATGPRYRFGSTEIEQDAIDPQLARRFLRYRDGEYFDASALLRTQFALEDSRYFSNVEVVTGTRDRESLSVPVTITAQRYRKHTYSIGVGYATDTRWRTTIAWDNRRINRAGHRSHTRITAADIEQSIEARYIIPVGDPALEKLSLDAELGREKLADLDVSRLELRPGLTQVHGSWQRVLFLATSQEITESTGSRTKDLLVIPGISYARVPQGFSGDMLSFEPGFYAEITGSHTALGSDDEFLRLHVKDEHVFDLATRWHLLLRGEIGVSLVAEFSELPSSQRFFAGGDNSVRGFSINELSPSEQAFDNAGNPILDEEGNPTYIKSGGRHLMVGSVELIRDLPRNFGVAAFFDIGNAVNAIDDPLEYSVGLGLRWRLPVVTVGVDVAQAISRSDLGPHFHLNISPKL